MWQMQNVQNEALWGLYPLQVSSGLQLALGGPIDTPMYEVKPCNLSVFIN